MRSEREEITMAIATINPATGEVVKTFDALTSLQIEQKLQLAPPRFEPFGGRRSRSAQAK